MDTGPAPEVQLLRVTPMKKTDFLSNHASAAINFLIGVGLESTSPSPSWDLVCSDLGGFCVCHLIISGSHSPPLILTVSSSSSMYVYLRVSREGV